MTSPVESQLVAALERAEKTGTTAQLANALDHLATHHHQNGAYAKAAPLYARALGMWRQILGPEHPVVGIQLVNLGSIYLHLGDVDAAEPVFRQALGIFETESECEDPGVITAFETFVHALRKRGRHDDADRFAERVTRVAQLIHELVRA